MTATDAPYTFPDNQRGTLNGVVSAVLELLRSKGAPPATQQQHVQELATNAKALATNVATRVKSKPVPPALIAAGIGIGLVFLFSKRARGAALTAGTFAYDQYKKHR